MDNRHVLGEVLPLEKPYTIQIFVNEVCNFKCFYCIKSKPIAEQNKNKVFSRTMEFEVYKKVIDQISDMGMIKMLLLVGVGEPLLHPRIADMVRYAKEKGVAEKIRIISNGSLLTHELSDALIEANLDSLKISIQGLDSESYRNVCGVPLDVNNLIDELKYFYENKKTTEISIKAMDFMLEGEARDRFFRMFEPVCDEIVIESVVPKTNSIDYAEKNIKMEKSFCNEEIIYSEICTGPFIRMFINVDGKAVTCCHWPYPFELGDATKSIKEIWNGEIHTSFLIKMLQGKRREIEICKECGEYLYSITQQEMLDNYKDELVEKYERILERKINGA